MPIQFRCFSCNQLLSIARRKVGTVVVCPQCAVELTVPGTDPGEPAAAEVPRPLGFATTPASRQATAPQRKPSAGDSGPLFERDDFERFLEPAIRKATEPRPEPVEPTAEPEFPQEASITISRGAAASLAVLTVVLLALAFGTGYLVGSQ